MSKITEYRKEGSNWQPWDYTSQPNSTEIPADGILRWKCPASGRSRSVKVSGIRTDDGLEVVRANQAGKQ